MSLTWVWEGEHPPQRFPACSTSGSESHKVALMWGPPSGRLYALPTCHVLHATPKWCCAIGLFEPEKEKQPTVEWWKLLLISWMTEGPIVNGLWANLTWYRNPFTPKLKNYILQSLECISNAVRIGSMIISIWVSYEKLCGSYCVM